MEIVETLAGDVAVRFHGGGSWFVMDRSGKVHQSPVEHGYGLMREVDAEQEISMAYSDADESLSREYDMGFEDGARDAEDRFDDREAEIREEAYAKGFEAGKAARDVA